MSDLPAPGTDVDSTEEALHIEDERPTMEVRFIACWPFWR